MDVLQKGHDIKILKSISFIKFSMSENQFLTWDAKLVGEFLLSHRPRQQRQHSIEVHFIRGATTYITPHWVWHVWSSILHIVVSKYISEIRHNISQNDWRLQSSWHPGCPDDLSDSRVLFPWSIPPDSPLAFHTSQNWPLTKQLREIRLKTVCHRPPQASNILIIYRGIAGLLNYYNIFHTHKGRAKRSGTRFYGLLNLWTESFNNFMLFFTGLVICVSPDSACSPSRYMAWRDSREISLKTFWTKESPSQQPTIRLNTHGAVHQIAVAPSARVSKVVQKRYMLYTLWFRIGSVDLWGPLVVESLFRSQKLWQLT